MEEFFTRGPWQREEEEDNVKWIGMTHKAVFYLYCLASLCVLHVGVQWYRHLTPDNNAYQFEFTALDGTPIRLSDYKGQVILVVNMASKSRRAEQLEGLETIYQRYRDQGFVVIGVPSQDFDRKEYISKQAIKKAAKNRYGVTFPLTTINRVKGKWAHLFYKWAQEQLPYHEQPLGKVTNNFHKYIIGKDGRIRDWFSHSTYPLLGSSFSKNMEEVIEDELESLNLPFPYNILHF